MSRKIFILPVILLFILSCSKPEKSNQEDENILKVKYEVSLSSFDDCRLKVLAVAKNNKESISKILSHNFTYEFVDSKESLLSVTGITVNKDNDTPKVDSDVIVTVKIYVNGKLVRNSSEKYINTQVFTFEDYD